MTRRTDRAASGKSVTTPQIPAVDAFRARPARWTSALAYMLLLPICRMVIVWLRHRGRRCPPRTRAEPARRAEARAASQPQLTMNLMILK